MQLLVSLLVLGAVFVAGVWVWGRIQASRSTQTEAAELAQEQQTSLLRQTRAEPALALPMDVIAPAEVTARIGADAVVLEVGLDADTEMVARLTAQQPLMESKIRELAGGRAAVGRRPVRYAWQAEAPSILDMGLTLADRTGAVGESELNHFLRLVDEVADVLGADVDVEPVEAAIARSRLLDAQCATLDTQLHLHLSGPSEPSGEELAAAARWAGITSALKDGAYPMMDAKGRELARVVPRPGRREGFVTLVVDVPRAPHGALDAALDAAAKMAEMLNAILVDDNGRPLSDDALALIRARLTDVVRKMTEAGLAPGSERARRVFS
ncbi:cell division protein ZipA C-terminal FtsZ-binding domain-containing protein [Piscinibacterium candidicorallinum]|jgi:hypothetical protein|uniref:Cell division protein ZipA n=1 Tax=Piscinibacterium candidicorallinum TaxID=1793872 RepID=A0ABV7H4A7_9BURK